MKVRILILPAVGLAPTNAVGQANKVLEKAEGEQ